MYSLYRYIFFHETCNVVLVPVIHSKPLSIAHVPEGHRNNVVTINEKRTSNTTPKIKLSTYSYKFGAPKEPQDPLDRYCPRIFHPSSPNLHAPPGLVLGFMSQKAQSIWVMDTPAYIVVPVEVTSCRHTLTRVLLRCN